MGNNCSVVDAQSNSITDFSDKLMMAFRAMKDALDYQSVYEKRKSSMESVARRINSYKVVSNAYAVETDKGVIGFNPAMAEAVKYVFEAVCNGETYPAILHTLNTKFKALARGKQWYHTNIMHILENLVYCGYAKNKQGDIARATNIPEPIISYSQFTQANTIASTKKAGYQKYNLKGQKKRNWLPYSGYIECDCGRRMLMSCDNGIVYHCINEGGHIQRIRMNAINHNQDFYLAMQALFAIRCIESRKALEASKAIDQTIDQLKSKLASLENSLKAKFRMITTDDDYELLKDGNL